MRFSQRSTAWSLAGSREKDIRRDPALRTCCAGRTSAMLPAHIKKLQRIADITYTREKDFAKHNQGGKYMGTVAEVERSVQSGEVYESAGTRKKTANYGRTVGAPELSEKAQKYYEELKKKYSNMDFVLVSNDMKEMAKAQAGSFANPNRLVVLIDEEKVERMAADEDFRKQYESVIGNAAIKLAQMKTNLGSKGSAVKAFGMQVDDGGNASFFAVVDKSLAIQKEQIQKNAAKKAEQKKQSEKKAAKKAADEKQAEKQQKAKEDKNLVTVTASSMDELLRKIDDTLYEARSDSLRTDAEKMIGQNFNFTC